MDCMQDQIIAKIRRIFFILFTGMGFVALSAPVLAAQSDSTFEIRVEAREVVVPFVVNRNSNNRYWYEKNVGNCFIKSPVPFNLIQNNLTMSEFHVFEDGVEQPIRSMSVIPIRLMVIYDSYGYHEEYSATPSGIWESPDSIEDFNVFAASVFNHSDNFSITGSQAIYEMLNNFSACHLLDQDQYLLSYTPRSSEEGLCHRIKVTLDRKDNTVYSRDEYCNVQHSPSDPLKGTKIAQTMEEYADTEGKGKIPLSIQAVSTFNNASLSRVNIAVEFPWKSLSTYFNGDYPGADVELLGMIYNKNGKPVKQFSDVAFSPRSQGPLRETVQNGNLPEVIAAEHLPTRYETQVDLAPGSYKIHIVLTDGKNFGRAAVPLTVETYDSNNIAVSGIVFGKRFIKMDVAWPQNVPGKDSPGQSKPMKREVSTALDYEPLVSKGIGITPTGDTVHYKKKHNIGDRMFSYFEVYEPGLVSGQVKVQYEMRVIDAKTAKTIVDTGLRSADSYVNPGKLIIPIAEGIAFKKLHTGAYFVEVQASDSTGKQTPWRSASFTVE